MAELGFNPGQAEVEVASDASLSTVPKEILEAPGGLYPLRTMAFEMDEYRTMMGWPVPIPPYDIHCHTMLSATGDVFGQRDDNTAIETGAIIRWVADPDYYDEATLEWRPLVDQTGGTSIWQTSVDYAPVLVDNYTYRVNSEVFIGTALNFDSDTRNHMWADFASTIGGAAGYTVVMVMSPNSYYGNDENQIYSGIWCPGGPTPEGDTFVESKGPAGWVSVTIQGGYLWFQNHGHGRVKTVAIQSELNSVAPMYLAMVIAPVESTFYVGQGPGRIRSFSVPTGVNQEPLNDGVLLGRSNGDVLHTADMALFDLGIYAGRLTPGMVKREFSILSRSYGGDA